MAKTQTIFPYKASHRFARSSVRKVRPILDLIRGKYVDDAVNILKYLPHRGARMAEQVLKSAMANAEDRGVREVGDLVVADARGDGGPMFKRLMPRARGMAYQIRRRSCHITIGLAEVESYLVAKASGGVLPEGGPAGDGEGGD
jgi:large subunit ribosomal protein L22